MHQLDIVAAVLCDVLDALRHRDASDPDSPACEAEARIEKDFASLHVLLERRSPGCDFGIARDSAG